MDHKHVSSGKITVLLMLFKSILSNYKKDYRISIGDHPEIGLVDGLVRGGAIQFGVLLHKSTEIGTYS